jgi:acyl carrier protein
MKGIAMNMIQIEMELIKCIKDNIEECGDDIPDLDESTSIFEGIAGFDSLRAIEVLVTLEDAVGCELPLEKVFTKKPPGTENIRDLASAINKIVNNE